MDGRMPPFADQGPFMLTLRANRFDTALSLSRGHFCCLWEGLVS